MPLIQTMNRQFTKMILKGNTMFKEGRMEGACDLELTYEASKLKNPSFKSIKSYVGNTLDGVFHGQGLLVFTNGDQYNGEFKFGRKEGEGVYTSKELGDEYHATWFEDLLNGQCQIKLDSDPEKTLVSFGDFTRGYNPRLLDIKQKEILKSYLSD